MTYHNAVKYIRNAPAEPENRNGEVVQTLCRYFGDPQKKLKYLRLAGSNGKTVCAAMLTSVMKQSNITVGCLTLPMREDVRDNIRIASLPLSIEETVDYASRVCRAVQEINRSRAEVPAETGDAGESGEGEPQTVSLPPLVPSRSEILLVMALLAFRDANCRLCLIESDHSGTDPSKFLPAPFAAVICGTIPSDEKQEIQRIRSYIRRGVQEIVSAPQDRDAYQILSDTCAAVNCRLTVPSRSGLSVRRLTLRGTDFSYRGKDYSLSLCGKFQIFNALVVLETLDMLSRHGFPVGYEAVCRGLAGVRLPGKFEVLSVMPLIIADSTHTPVAIRTVCDSMADFREITGNKIRLFLPAGDLIGHYCQVLAALGYEIVQITVLCGKEETPATEGIDCPVKIYTSRKEAIRQTLAALEKDTFLLISGTHAFTDSVRYDLLGALGF